MATPNFFADIEVLKCLLKMKADHEKAAMDLTLDIIDLPYWFSLHSDEKAQTMKVYNQIELYSKNESIATESGSLVMERATGKAEVKAPKALADNMPAFFEACRNLSAFARERSLETLTTELDPEEAGLLLSVKDGEIEWKVVVGGERPELTLQTLFGGVTKGRPYMDDFFARSELEEMNAEELEAAAAGGNAEAMEELAKAYLNGDEDREIGQNFPKAVYWWEKLAETGNSIGMFNAGLHYAKGCGVARDFGRATEWMKKSAEAGDEDAPALVEKYLGMSENAKKAEAGDAAAMAAYAEGLMSLGASLEQAGPGEDYAESLRWAQKSADLGCGDAYWPLALAYEHGRGVNQNKKKAIDLYRQGAKLGNAPCQHSYGCCLMRGELIKKDEKQAVALFRQSAEQGYGLAMRDLGRCYQFGNGCLGNMKTAVEWYEKALEKIDDPELARKTALFKAMGENDPSWGEDYAGAPEDGEIPRDEIEAANGGHELPPGYMEALALAEAADDAGFPEQEPREVVALSEQLAFLMERAKNGDSAARRAVADYFRGNPEDPAATPETLALVRGWQEEPDPVPAPADGEAEAYDDQLSFKTPKGYRVDRSTNNEGEEVFRLIFEGDGAAEEPSPWAVTIKERDIQDFDDDKSNLKGNFKAAVQAIVKDQKVLFFEVKILVGVVIIVSNGRSYSFTCFRAGKPEEVESNAEEIARHLNAVLNAMVLKGERGSFERLTGKMLLNTVNTEDDAPAAADDEFPKAVPDKGQHTHLDFQSRTKSALSLFGGLMVNQTGTEYAFHSVQQYSGYMDDERMSKLLSKAAGMDRGSFAAAERALEMSRLFRVTPEAFDPAHDREQEIRCGYIQRVLTYDSLRSFAWTLGTYCEAQKAEPKDVDYATLKAIAAFVGRRGGLNFKAGGACPTLCSGDDIHTYFLPDAFDPAEQEELLRLTNVDAPEGGPKTAIASLEGLRRDLDWLYPAMETIHEELSYDRDPNEALVGPTADLLYAWCSMTYAAKEPIFTEDGPVNNQFEHPEVLSPWLADYRKRVEQMEREHKEEWLKKHGKDLDRNARISIPGKKFVFDGVGTGWLPEELGTDAENGGTWPKILEKLIEKGGIHRTAISGKTDYLVCDPRRAGDAKIRDVHTQRLQGRCKETKIVLAEDFFDALGYDPEKTEKKRAEEKKTVQPVKKERPAVDTSGMKVITLSYSEGKKVRGSDYEMDIPDGFLINENEEDRDFAAWLPVSGAESYENSAFVILSGKLMKTDTVAGFATSEEFEAIAKSVSDASNRLTGTMFEDMKYLTYPRTDLPGGISIAYDRDMIHASLFAGTPEGIRMMRLQISGVERRDRPAWDKVITETFDHIHADHPVQLLEQPDSDRFLTEPVTDELVKEWSTLADKYREHYGNVRTLRQNAMVERFKSIDQPGQEDVNQLKKQLRQLMKECAELNDGLLRRCERIYLAFRAKAPESKPLNAAYNVPARIAADCEFTVNLNNEPITVRSDYAGGLADRIGKSPDALAKEKRQAEEKAKAAEERKRQEEEKQKKETAWAEWEKACENTRRQRETALAKAKEARKAELRATAEQTRDTALKALDAEQEKTEQAKKEAETRLAGLGFFKFSEKKALRTEIERITSVTIPGQLKHRDEIKENCRKELDGIQNRVEQETSLIESRIEREYPMPPQPQKPDSVLEKERREEQEKTERRNSLASEGKRGYQKIDILDYIENSGPMTVPEMLENIPMLEGESNQYVSALCRQLLMSGLLEKYSDKRRTYFKIPD